MRGGGILSLSLRPCSYLTTPVSFPPCRAGRLVVDVAAALSTQYQWHPPPSCESCALAQTRLACGSRGQRETRGTAKLLCGASGVFLVALPLAKRRRTASATEKFVSAWLAILPRDMRVPIPGRVALSDATSPHPYRQLPPLHLV